MDGLRDQLEDQQRRRAFNNSIMCKVGHVFLGHVFLGHVILGHVFLGQVFF